MTHLRERQGGGEINDEVGLQIPGGNGGAVHNKLAAAEDTGAWGDECGLELHDHVEKVEEVGYGPEDSDDDA